MARTLPVAALSCIALIAARAGALHGRNGWAGAVGDFVYPLVTISLFLLALDVAHAAGRLRWPAGLDRASYGIYLVHLPLVVLLQYLLVGAGLGPVCKALVVAAAGGAASYLLATLLVRLPGTRAVV